MAEKEYDLAASRKAIGALYPILVDAQGRYIDGKHRHQVDSDWEVEVRTDIETDLQLHLARLVANFCRRKMDADEITEELTHIAKLTGWNSKQISEATGIPDRTVRYYLPDAYKDKEMQELRERRELKRETRGNLATKTERKQLQQKEIREREKPKEVSEPEVPFAEFTVDLQADDREKFIDGLNMWFLSAGDPVLMALSKYCIDKEIHWYDVVKQALIEFFQKPESEEH